MNQCLTELFLGDNFLVPSDANTVSAMLKSNSTLQLLDVRNNMLQVMLTSNYAYVLVEFIIFIKSTQGRRQGKKLQQLVQYLAVYYIVPYFIL